MSPTDVKTIRFDEFYNIVDNKGRTSEKKHQGVNPSTGEKLWDVPVGTQQDVDDAVIAAQKAFETFRYTPVEERKEYLKKFKEAWLSYADELTDLMCAETGKPRQFAAYEVKAAAAFFDWHISLEMPVDRLEDASKIVTTRYTPLGVIGAICPWNFPILLSIGKVIPSILTGNSIIVKPSPFTPYTALKMAEIGATVLPAGVFQVLGGDDMLGPMLTAHPGIAKISFTGSIATGKKIMASCAQTLKRVTLELGGNDAAVILPDVDVKKIAPELVMGAFQNSGQVCVATKRIYIHQDIYDELLAEMVTAVKNLKIGSPDSGSIIGPVQNYMQYQRVKEFFADSKTHGYKFAVGDAEPVDSSNGFFLKPTIIDNPPNDSRIIQEEPFGPIVPTQPWSDEAEVIKRANNTNAGLGACVWGKDIERAEAIASKLEAGSVFINSFERPTPQAYFSGHKESGIGGEWGKDGIKAYCNAHVTHLYKNKF